MANSNHTDTDKILLDVSKKYIQITQVSTNEFVSMLSEFSSEAISESFDEYLTETPKGA